MIDTRRTLRSRAIALLLCAPLLACGGGGEGGGGGGGGGPSGPDLAVASVTATAVSSTVDLGGTLQLSASARNAGGGVVGGRTFTWSTSNATVATVDGAGLVTGLALGPVTITATETGSSKAGAASLTVAPPAVATVAVTPATATVAIGLTQAFSAALADARGAALTGRVVTWSSADAAIATVNATTGVVTGVAAGGPIAITATSEGRTGVAQVTVPAVPVATVAITAFASSVLQASTTQLAVTLRDASGATLTGRTVTWTSSNTAVATVSASGLLTAVAVGGPVTITATAEGKSATASVSVTARTAARVAVAPRFAAVSVGADSTFRADAFDAAGVAIPSPVTTWTTGAGSIATVTTAGVVRGVATGQTTIVAKVNAAADTAVVAVLGAGSLLSTAFVGGTYAADVRPGQTITVPVVLDLSRASATGDLGAAQFELTYDPAVLTYVSATANATGSSNTNSPSAGSFKFSFAHTAPQGTGVVTLATVTFTVASTATVGTVRSFGLAYVGQPASTSFQNYAAPIVIGGRLRVVAP